MKSIYSHLEDEVLLAETEVAAKKEKEATLALLEYLLEVDRRKVYAIRSYSSMHDYLQRHLKYSDTQAAERVNAMRLLRSTPEIKFHLENGDLTLTSAAQIQRFIQTEKKNGNAISAEIKSAILEKCAGQSKRTIQKTLFAQASVPTQLAMKERIRQVGSDRVELKFSIDESTQQKLDELKNLVGNKTLETLFSKAIETMLAVEKKKRGTNKNESQTSTLPAMQPYQSDKRYIPADLKRGISQYSNGRCEFVDSKTGMRCTSQFRLQIDHRIPLALGGKTELKNLRHLCSNHNARAAIEAGLNIKRAMK